MTLEDVTMTTADWARWTEVLGWLVSFLLVINFAALLVGIVQLAKLAKIADEDERIRRKLYGGDTYPAINTRNRLEQP
jgi:ascorbate-specific PTS system EIIC-type component UlaA